MKRYWLIKSEATGFSLDDLIASPDRITSWDGVRNYQARNFMRDDMHIGDLVLFYHSVKNPAIVGLVKVVRESYPDHTAWETENSHFDRRSTAEKPLWFMVDVQYVETFSNPLSLAFLRTVPELGKMELLRKGSRLSVMPVGENEFALILQLAHSRFGQKIK